MKRLMMENLQKWLLSSYRRPMLLSGVSQCGKTWLVRQLAKENGLDLIELNFSRHPRYKELFRPEEIPEIIDAIESELDIKIDLNKSLLFLDDIHAFPEIIGKLRWFYEDLPELAVIAASSLMDFALEEYEGSFPVGRVTFRKLYPLSFLEFLRAMDEEKLAEDLIIAARTLSLLQDTHEKCLAYFRQYCMVGGMPEAVQTWADSKNLNAVRAVQEEILFRLQNNLHMIKGNMPVSLLMDTMESSMKQAGFLFSCSKVNETLWPKRIRQALLLLKQADIIHMVKSRNDVPVHFGNPAGSRSFRVEFADTGLMQKQWVTSNVPLAGPAFDSLDMLWKQQGALAKQIAGQLFRGQSPWRDYQPWCWKTPISGSASQIDFLLEQNMDIIPVLVKTGTPGSLKSLHHFAHLTNCHQAIRLDLNPPVLQQISVQTTTGNPVKYTLLSFPLYMAELVWQTDI